MKRVDLDLARIHYVWNISFALIMVVVVQFRNDDTSPEYGAFQRFGFLVFVVVSELCFLAFSSLFTNP